MHQHHLYTTSLILIIIRALFLCRKALVKEIILLIFVIYYTQHLHLFVSGWIFIYADAMPMKQTLYDSDYHHSCICIERVSYIL